MIFFPQDSETTKMKTREQQKRKPQFGFLFFLLFLQPTTSKEETHSRQKRILWITSDGRLALPPGTTMIISPSLSLPFVRYPPDGFFSNMTISLPFTSKYGHIKLNKGYMMKFFFFSRLQQIRLDG